MEILNAWTVTRVVKLVALAWFVLGLSGSTLPASRGVRLRATYLIMVPGFVATYGTGWLLMKTSGRSLLTPWLLASVIAGASAFHLGFLVSHREKPRRVTTMLAWGSLAVAIALMSLRPVGAFMIAGVVIAGLIVGALASLPAYRIPTLASDDRDEVWRGLRWITWFEAGSLLLVLAAMPLRRALGFSLDDGTGLVGWTHGVLVLVFIQSLSSAVRLFRWPRSEIAWGILSVVVPGAGFWLERRMSRRFVSEAESRERVERDRIEN